ncbi:N-6 DNA methylase, partial [Streptomyces sp. TRM76130]|nr:N-6 DNA methylase [Streptomyces sp. TRM76130]
MSDDGFDELPHGWRRIPLGAICDIQAGGPTVRRNEHVRAGIPVVRPADLRHRRISARSVAHISP